MGAHTYLDFDLQIDDLGDGRYRAYVLASPAGQAEAFFDLPFSDLELENFFLRIGRPRRGIRRINSAEMNEARQFSAREYRVLGNQAVIDRFLDEESQGLAMLSDFIGKPISLQAEPSYSQEQYDIVLM